MTTSLPPSIQIDSANPLDIRLDPDNPRLPPAQRGGDQAELIQLLIRSFHLDDLGRSIAEKGYLPYDPIVTFRNEEGNLVVREGNRRIAVLQLLLNPNRAPEGKRARWKDLAKRASGHQATMSPIPVFVAENPDEPSLLAYIGFRHVSGILQWKSFEKAQYIAQLVEKGLDYSQVAREIGSRSDAVERHYVAHQLVDQAKSLDIPGHKVPRRYFGILLRALNTPGTRAFLGLEYPGDTDKSRRPVPGNKSQALAEFVKWTFGTDDDAPVVEDSRQLSKWGTILESAEALSYLRSAGRPTFERTLFKAAGEKESVVDLLSQAATRLEEAIPHIRRNKDDKDVHQFADLCADYISQILINFPEIAKKYGFMQ